MLRGRGIRRIKQAALLCVWLLLFSMIACLSTARALDRRLVRVAFFPMDGYHEREADGTYTGMDVEYLTELCKYVNWRIEYVRCESWDEALRMLADKEVDLVGSAQYSAARAEQYQYADLASGYTFGIIAANGNSTLAYEDFDAMRSITFGMVKTYVRRAEFLDYMRDNGVRSPRIREYDSAEELRNALHAGEVDAMVHSFMEVQKGQRLIGRFAPRPFYYITYQGNDEIMRELNYAIADMKMNEPALEAELMNKYYQSRLDKTIVFTTKEKEFIETAEPIIVGYFDSYYPFVYEDGGSCAGLTHDMLEHTLGLVGLKLEWKKIDNPAHASEALLNDEIDVMSYCVHRDEETKQNSLSRLREYTQIPLLLVMEKDEDSSDIQTMATMRYLEDEAAAVSGLAEDGRLVLFDTQEECLDAVREGKADAALCDGYLAEYQLSAEMRYYNLEIRRVLNQEHGVAMTVRSDDTLLAAILNKTMMTIDARAVSDYMMERNIYTMSSVGQVIQDNSVFIIIVLLLLLGAAIGVVVNIIRDNKKIQKLMYKDIEIDIWNLNHLIYTGRKELEGDRGKYTYAVAYLNIVQFQRYKVVYGWNNGQKLLSAIANVLSQCVQGKREICAKGDGDHFALLLSSEYGDIMERLQNLCGLVEEYIFHQIGNHVTVQAGLRVIPEDSADLRDAIVCASQAIDLIEPGEDTKIKVFDAALAQTIRERHERQNLLDSVSVEENFAAYYQAKVDVRTERVVGAEALVRFLDPTADGAVRAPGFFVPYYEETGKVTEVDFFVLRRVCQMLRRRLDAGLSVVTISCNFSRLHFMKEGFAKRLLSTIEEYHIPKGLIEVEVTETVVMEELQQKAAEQTMQELYANGIRLSIDDFGSGYSSLGVIEKIPAAVIKLDRSFLLNQKDRERQVKIMKRIVDLARDLNAEVVCEGVETEADVQLMMEIGAHVAQGYRYAKPVPETDFEARLNRQTPQGSPAPLTPATF